MSFSKKIEGKIKKAPRAPGIYIFKEKKKPIYIGKASNLRNRLKSYLKPNSFKNERLMENATDIKTVVLRSEIEALIEEAKLIKKYNPAYNVLWRDDATYFYAAFTKPLDSAQGKEKFPRIFVVHKNVSDLEFQISDFQLIGPFTEGRALKLVLKMLRRRFPYCTCRKPHFRICLNAQIGNCFGFCCIVQRSVNAKLDEKNRKAAPEETKKYRKNVEIIKNFLLGNPLKNFSGNLKPEDRAVLEKILAHREFLELQSEQFEFHPNIPNTKKHSENSDVFAGLNRILIEGYDISHLSGKETVAAMTAWIFKDEKLLPRKNFWRKFIIRTAKSGDDPAAIFEAVSRRLKHPEWPYPDLIVVDGGAGQFNAAKKAAKNYPEAGNIEIISFAKPEEKIYGIGVSPLKLSGASSEIKKTVPAVISRTHDFAIAFHRQRRKKSFMNFRDKW